MDASIPLILYFVDKDYRENHPDVLAINKDVNLNHVLQTAEKNKLSYSFCEGAIENDVYSLFNRVALETAIKQMKEEFDGLRRTLSFVASSLNDKGLDFLVIKTFKGLPYITQDVDILVREEQFQRAISILKSKGALKLRLSKINEALMRILHRPEDTYWKSGLLKIDVYKDLSWVGLPCFDEDFLWKNPRLTNIYGVECLIPNREADLLSLIAHAIFFHGYITLLDFLYINSLLENDLKFNDLSQQTRKYGWYISFLTLISTIRNIYQGIRQNENTSLGIKFPYIIPLRIILRSYQGCVRSLIALGMKPSSLSRNFGSISFQLCMLLKDRYISD